MIIYYVLDERKYDEFIAEHSAVTHFVYKMDLGSNRYVRVITEFIKKFGKNAIKDLYDKIDVKYDEIINEWGYYKLNGELLTPSNLSTAESGILFAFICKKLMEDAIIIGLLEACDPKHRRILLNEFIGSKDKVAILVRDNQQKVGTTDYFEWRYIQ